MLENGRVYRGPEGRRWLIVGDEACVDLRATGNPCLVGGTSAVWHGGSLRRVLRWAKALGIERAVWVRRVYVCDGLRCLLIDIHGVIFFVRAPGTPFYEHATRTHAALFCLPRG